MEFRASQAPGLKGPRLRIGGKQRDMGPTIRAAFPIGTFTDLLEAPVEWLPRL